MLPMSGNMDLEKYISYAELLSQVNNSCVFLIETNNKFLYASSNFNTFFGYDIEKINDISNEGNYLNNRIHPDDEVIFSTIQKRLFDFWYSQPVESRQDYKHIYEFRVLNSDDEYIRVISQHQILEMDENGNPYLVLGVADISPDHTNFDGIKFRLLNMKTGKIVPFPLNDEININLTKRELEILRLVNSGMFSKEISDKLSISIHTVNNHRQNILQKLNIDNMFEAINYAKKLRLLD